MSNYTFEQLEQALGSNFKLESIGQDKTQARVLTADGFDVAFIDFECSRLEVSLDAKWHVAANVTPEGFPDSKAIAAARQEIAEELQPDWEIEGFTVPEEGEVTWYHYAKEPKTKIPMYRMDVSKEVSGLQDAVKAIRWVRSAETETWV